MASRTSKKSPIRWAVIAKILRRNEIEISEGKGSRKKLKKQTPKGTLKSTVHVHNKGVEIEPCYIDQIIDKFGLDESEFFG